MNEIVENLKILGLNSYEAKVYIALLKKYPATGYEVSKLANVPQSRTYDTLKQLEQKQIVVSTNTKPITYTPIKPTELTKRFKRSLTTTLDFLDRNLPKVKDDYTEPILTVTGRYNIHKKVEEVIKNASKEIYMEVWSQDYKFFEKDLKDAYNRNVEIRMVGYDSFKSNFGTVFEHAFAKEIENSLGGRMIIIAADNSEGVFGKISSTKDEETNIIWTKNNGIVFLIKEFIVHDMYLIDVEENLSDQMKYIYGKNMKRLKDKVLGEHNLYRIH